MEADRGAAGPGGVREKELPDFENLAQSVLDGLHMLGGKGTHGPEKPFFGYGPDLVDHGNARLSATNHRDQKWRA